MNKQDRITTAIIGISLYLIATGLSFAAFSFFGKGLSGQTKSPTVTTGADGWLVIDPSVPRTESCPINGQLFTKQERDIWGERRPLAVMVENHLEARPQSGLSSADVVYEAVVEGGVTRFMGIFYCGASAKNLTIAPVRSARTPFLPYVLEYDALYTHVGGAGNCNDDTVDPRAKALCQIDQYNIKDMDQFGLPFKTKDADGKTWRVCERNYDRLGHEVPTEHTMVCYTNGLYAVASVDRKWTNVDAKGVAWDARFKSWSFKDDAKEGERGSSQSASFVASKGYEVTFGVRWDYDPISNSYKRVMGGDPHIDLETKKQIEAKVVILQFAKEVGPVDDHLHMLYENIGSGDVKILEDGKVIKATWKKVKRTDRTQFYDTGGKEVKFNRGQIWVELLATGTPVTAE